MSQARILLYFPPVVRSRGNIHSFTFIGRVICKGEVSYCGQSHGLGLRGHLKTRRA